jgi:hypothetical protein
MKFIYYFLERFKKQNIKKSIPIYLFVLLTILFYGVKGLIMTTFIILTFVAGWISKGLWQAIKDYRLTLTLNRVHFSKSDYETLKRENSALLTALESYMKNTDNARGRGVQGPLRPSNPSTPANRSVMNMNDIEEIRLRYEMEERER